jgi:hypothetical protein
MQRKSKAFFSSFFSISLAFLGPLFIGASLPAYGDDSNPQPEETPTIFVTPGGDDSSYEIPLTQPVFFFGQEFTSIYATPSLISQEPIP